MEMSATRTRATQANTFAHADADTKANLITEGSGINLHEDFTLFSSGGLIKKRKKLSWELPYVQRLFLPKYLEI